MAFSTSCFSLSKSLLYSRHSAISTNLYHNIKSRQKQEIGLSSITNEQCVFCGFSRKHSHDAKYSTGSFQSRRSSRYLVKIRASASSATEATQDTQNIAENLVDALLSMVEETDRGAKLSKPEHDKIAGTVSQLEQFCIPEPLKSPLIFGDWDVDYCSNPTSTGGYYRSAIGRLLLRTKEMTQTIQSPDIVGNKVSFSALNMIDGEVSLKGHTCITKIKIQCMWKVNTFGQQMDSNHF